MDVTKKQIAKYIFLPGILPRVKELALNLNWFAYLMAVIFAATRILPANHPYLSRAQQGKFGISDILFEAGRNLKGGIRHIDQYIVYVSFVLAVILLLGQFVVLLFVLATHTAEAAAATPTFRGMFVTRQPYDDLAMMMLDKVFEIPNMFGSKFNAASFNDITPFGKALHRIFAFYNQGMLIIAGLIVLYYMFAVVIETMQTGTPFGQRFQEVFVPIRIILALLFLVPLGYGFSSGQLLVLKLAQWGSGFATNGWIIFNQKAGLNPLGSDNTQLIVSPKTEEVESLFRFYSLVHSCRAVYQQEYKKDIQPFVVYRNGTENRSTSATGLNYATALGYFRNGPIEVTFGEKNASFTNLPGNVKPYCGKITLPTHSSAVPGARQIHATYWSFLQQLWTDKNLKAYGNRMARNFTQKTDIAPDAVSVDGWPNPDTAPEVGFYANVRTDLQARFASLMEQTKGQLRNDVGDSTKMNADLLKRGWGGAGIWYNKIAEYNGAIVTANAAVPVPSSYPAVMQFFLSQKKTTDNNMGNLTQFITTFGNGGSLRDMMSGGGLDNPATDGKIATFLGDIHKKLSAENVYGDGTEIGESNIIAKTFNLIYGTQGLFELRGNQQIHPLAKMSALGRSILDRALTYIGGAMVMGGLSGLSSVVDNKGLSQAFAGLGSMFSSFAVIGITVGIVLYYVIPFLPFLYFFFAVGRWVKSVFEAVVGIPLWALAHLRIDGEGIAGQAAAQGYFLLLEILLRPILVIFGLMASVACFTALAITLDTVFDLVIVNVTGYTPIDAQGAYSLNGIEFKRGYVDQFFYTVMYAVLLYLMATSCFKLIDLIPNSVLRFIGTGVAEFNDQMNLEQDVVRYTGLASYTLTDDVAKAAQEIGTVAGQTVVLPVNVMNDLRKSMPDQPQPQPQPQTQQEQPKQPDRPPEKPPGQPEQQQEQPVPPPEQPEPTPPPETPTDENASLQQQQEQNAANLRQQEELRQQQERDRLFREQQERDIPPPPTPDKPV